MPIIFKALKSKVLVVHVLNPKMVSDGDNNNKEIDRQTFIQQPTIIYIYIKSAHIKWDIKAKC